VILTEGQIKAQVRAIRKKSSRSALGTALQSDGPWSGSSHLTIDGQLHRVAFCRSDLELREQLRLAGDEGEHLVALCPFNDAALGEDVLARLAKRRVHPPQSGEIIGSLFQATSVDSRVLASTGLTNALIEYAPADGYDPVAGGVLDLQTAWSELLGRALGNREAGQSLARLLESTSDASFRSRLEKLPFELRQEFFAWAALNLDRSSIWLAYPVNAGRTADLIPLGLLLELVFAPAVTVSAEIMAARVRLESWFGGQVIDAATARSWAAAARSAIHALRLQGASRPLVSAILVRFDELLSEFKISEAASQTDFSPAGFEQRLRQFAQLLAPPETTATVPVDQAEHLFESIHSLRRHLFAGEHQRRIERCEMAARLTSWLGEDARLADGTSLGDMITGYARLGGFVDWAKNIVQEGDSEPLLNKAYDSVLARVEQFCGPFEAAFAAKLAEWTLHGAASNQQFMPVENALENLVGSWAAQAPVLLLVMDGMSVAVFRELIGDIVERGNWLECSPSQPKVPAALLATVPSVTEVSRRALFRGKLHPESTPTEQSAFGANDRLFSLCGGQTRPVLFLKGDLQTAGEAGLAFEVKAALANPKCRVVATVVNAVDDHLGGSDQIAPRWDLDFVRPLRELLQLAAAAGRAVILTSDHGHILEHQTSLKSGVTNGGDRYRTDGGTPSDGELRVTGQRIQQALGRPEVVAAWSRNLRYAGKKRGYHGGVSPLEMVIPFAVLFHRSGITPAGWTEVAPSPSWPSWWRLSSKPNPAPVALVVQPAVVTKETAGLELFTHAATKSRANDWVGQLLDGEVYAEQCKLAVRGAPDRKQVAMFLEALIARGGTMPREALAERLGLPLLRLNGLVPNLARIFNVDGYEVLNHDATSGTITLNVVLLKKQFAMAD
jgi:hypothetical protein